MQWALTEWDDACSRRDYRLSSYKVDYLGQALSSLGCTCFWAAALSHYASAKMCGLLPQFTLPCDTPNLKTATPRECLTRTKFPHAMTFLQPLKQPMEWRSGRLTHCNYSPPAFLRQCSSERNKSSYRSARAHARAHTYTRARSLHGRVQRTF